MNQSRKQRRAMLGVVFGLLLAHSIAFGQTRTIELTVDDPRPMRAAVHRIAEFYGIPINYEDIPINYSFDLREFTDLPRGWQLSFPIPVEASTGKQSDIQAVKDALSNLIFVYNSSGLPGRFDFEEYNGVFFVKPVSERKALLSTPIILPEEKRHFYLTLHLIFQQISKATGSHIGGPPYPLQNTGEQSIGADNEPAGHVIARVLAAMACPTPAREGCGPVIAQTTLDVGYYFDVGYITSQYGYALVINRLPGSRWIASPPPSPKPLPQHTPSPNRLRSAGGARKR